jgi:hypothetical protein
MKKNPLACYRNDLFGSRGVDVGAALTYVNELATASSDGVAVQTAAYVLLNTMLGAMDQVLNAPSPERLALIDLIDERIKANSSDIDQQISDWMDANLDVNNQISEWMSDNFDASDYNVEDVVDDKIGEWASDNLADEVEKVIKNSLTFSVQVN